MSHRPSRHRPTADAPRLTRPGSARARLAFVLALVAQLFAVVVVPVAHASISRPLAAHIDLPGSPHHTHDEAGCAPCSASHLLGDVPRIDRDAPRAADFVVLAPAAALAAPAVAPHRTAAAPRAPPTPTRVG